MRRGSSLVQTVSFLAVTSASMGFLRFMRSRLAAALGMASKADNRPLREPVGRDAVHAPPVSALPGIDNPAAYWPASLAHVALPYDNPGAEYVTIGAAFHLRLRSDLRSHLCRNEHRKPNLIFR
jgi:hypothetical protein